MEAMAALTGMTALFITVAAIVFLIRSVFVPGARGSSIKRALLSIFFVFVLMMASNYFASERDQQFRAAAEAGGFDNTEEYIAARKFHVKNKTEYAKAKAEQEVNLKANEEQKEQQKLYKERKQAELEMIREEQKQSKLKVEADSKQAELKEAEKKSLPAEMTFSALATSFISKPRLPAKILSNVLLNSRLNGQTAF